jgi:hypothetical protein
MKIGIIIPATSKDHEHETIFQSLLSKSIISFCNSSDKEHEYIFYIGIDKEDILYDNLNNQNELKKLMNLYSKTNSIKFIYMTGINKGHLTIMWNRLANAAYNEGCDFFYQCGDDILYKTKGWVNDSIKVLSNNKYIGVTGPFNNNKTILTQTFVSRRHIDIFGYYFPEEITNWYCDDWINEVYKKCGLRFALGRHVAINVGGKPRYNPKSDRKLCDVLVIRDVNKLKKYLSL